MSGKYSVSDGEVPHFISFGVVNWIDALTRNEYTDIMSELGFMGLLGFLG